MRLHYRDPQLRTAFAPWAPHPEALALAGLSGLTAALKFEAPCPNGVSTIPPHLDVLLERGIEIVGVQVEVHRVSRREEGEVAEAYRRLAAAGDERTRSREPRDSTHARVRAGAGGRARARRARARRRRATRAFKTAARGRSSSPSSSRYLPMGTWVCMGTWVHVCALARIPTVTSAITACPQSPYSCGVYELGHGLGSELARL
jgi:hypothetical protein